MPTQNLIPPHLSPDRNVAFLMASIISKLEQELRNSTLRKLDMTYIHFRVLQYLLGEDGKKVGDIATAIAARPPVVSRVVDQMEERSLVRRGVDPSDNRLTRVYLTADGRDKYALAWPAAHKLIEYALDVLEPEEREEFQRCLRKVGEHVCS
jgi:DNA-binding MarR family transcriptional regulator